MLESWVHSGHLVDLILALMGLELVAIAWLRRRRLMRLGTLDAFCAAVAGGGILMALRAALTGAAYTAIAGWLFVALVGHALDLYRRGRPPGR